MSDEYTPRTDEVRSWATFVPDQTVGMHVSERDAAAFDRWLAEVKREAAAEGWDEGRAQGIEDVDMGGYGGIAYTPNPYRPTEGQQS